MASSKKTGFHMVTLFYAAILALFMLFLSYRVIVLRRGAQVAFGDAKNLDLKARSRAFGNFIEYVSMILILMLLVEIVGGSLLFLHIVGITTVLGRVFHAYGLNAQSKNISDLRGRTLGTSLTLLSILALAIYALFLTTRGMGAI